eukprot:m.159404 g.159404  ORF g.159404 m.159404 type:complete len:126 (-) comp16347_c2_seq8:861-1238(-)
MMGSADELLDAAKEGDGDGVQSAIARGADVNCSDCDNNTPLHWASRNGHLDVARLLIERGADVMTENECNEMPLHFASRNGHLDVVRLLIERGADILAKDSDVSTGAHVLRPALSVHIVSVWITR